MNMMGQPTVELDSFEQWICERPEWLQSVAEFLISNKRMPNDSELESFVALCEQEAKELTGKFTTISAGSLNNAAIKPQTRINKITNISGVNAIRMGSTLDFGGGNLTVIFGSNGSGKSSYSRLLKKICGSKAQEEILGNIFTDNQHPISADVEVCLNNQPPYTYSWLPNGSEDQNLKHVHIFDNKTAQIYMNKSEATYEPMRMRFISLLIKVCDKVYSILQSKKDLLTSHLPQLPVHLYSSSASDLINSLSAKTTIEFIDSKCTYTDTDDQERVQIEATLAKQDIPSLLKEIEATKSSLKVTGQYIDKLKELTSIKSLEFIVKAKHQATYKRKLAVVEANRVFSNSELEGVGQEVWISLWNKAKEYSEHIAYPNHNFPFTGEHANCVLCHQPLTDIAKARLNGFEDFIRSSLENDANLAERAKDQLLAPLKTCLTQGEWTLHLEKLKLNKELVDELFEQLNVLIETVLQTDSINELTVFNWDVISEAYERKLSTIEVEEQSLIAVNEDDSRKALEQKLKELKSSQWLYQNKSALVAERSRLITIAEFDKALKLCSTTALTRKKTELAVDELELKYIQRFEEELKKLGGTRIPIKPISVAKGKGKILFDLAIQGKVKDVQTHQVLSEGETRVVALAAFLADITGSGQNTPFIFDDPICSLDHVFEERVVERLIELSKERQVIIFTHRLSLIALVQDAGRKATEKAKCLNTNPTVNIHIENITRFRHETGIVSNSSIRNEKPTTALNKMLSTLIPKLENYVKAGDVENFEREAYNYCSEFRAQVEKCVEYILLNEVVLRFRRSLQTQGRLPTLAKIRIEDCDLIDDLMTRYSVFEHSQPFELHSQSPDFEVIKEDTQKLAQWIKDFKKRSLEETEVLN
ncbi:AAA family ATPase [Acinetobacter shaoyimingii]|uniref:AAA family ATPase n=1 Tax=Acinetobacter shaoyimingii TaxID=2715164 RepID=A0A6G8RRX0_9GAMM|nr:AAA family ATPase [Acinetobacter shaoyimingii]QIO04682.1 AAA family ATPase [Acinetobacter shaoyimingii]